MSATSPGCAIRLFDDRILDGPYPPCAARRLPGPAVLLAEHEA
ncbi:hypothetical protein ACH5AO_25200 [Streptomyces sp. NPDC018964]